MEPEENLYFMRVVVDDNSLGDSKSKCIEKLEKERDALKVKMQIFDNTVPLKMAIFVTKEAAPLHDLLIKQGNLIVKSPLSSVTTII